MEVAGFKYSRKRFQWGTNWTFFGAGKAVLRKKPGVSIRQKMIEFFFLLFSHLSSCNIHFSCALAIRKIGFFFSPYYHDFHQISTPLRMSEPVVELDSIWMLPVIVPILCVVSDFSCNLTLYQGHRITWLQKLCWMPLNFLLFFFLDIVFCVQLLTAETCVR